MASRLKAAQDEYSRLFEILNFRFNHRYKRLGILGAISILLGLIVYKFIGSNTLIVKDVLRTVLLLFLLIASLSKDAVEDEYSNHIRFQSYVLAFVVTTVYAILIPLVTIVMDILITYITGDGSVSFYEISAFEVLFMLMGMQLLFLEALKGFSCV